MKRGYSPFIVYERNSFVVKLVEIIFSFLLFVLLVVESGLQYTKILSDVSLNLTEGQDKTCSYC